MPTNHLYHTWFQRIRELRPGQRISQTRNFVWLILEIQVRNAVDVSRQLDRWSWLYALRQKSDTGVWFDKNRC